MEEKTANVCGQLQAISVDVCQRPANVDKHRPTSAKLGPTSPVLCRHLQKSVVIGPNLPRFGTTFEAFWPESATLGPVSPNSVQIQLNRTILNRNEPRVGQVGREFGVKRGQLAFWRRRADWNACRVVGRGLVLTVSPGGDRVLCSCEGPLVENATKLSPRIRLSTPLGEGAGGENEILADLGFAKLFLGLRGARNSRRSVVFALWLDT